MTEWQPIETAPRNGTPILAWCKSECGDADCSYSENYRGGTSSLCLYHGHAEGMSSFGDGLCIVEWGGSWDDSSWEYPNQGRMPDWWFRVGSEFEESANPIYWMPLPHPPSQSDGG